jgi:hypothetical protein
VTATIPPHIDEDRPPDDDPADELHDEVDQAETDDDAELFDDIAIDDQPTDDPTPGGRERARNLIGLVLLVAAVIVVALRLTGWNPLDLGRGSTDAPQQPIIEIRLPQELLDAAEVARTPGGLTSFANRPNARDLTACDRYPPLSNEALWGMGSGDANALCERALENGIDPCKLYIGVATTDKGAVFYLSTDGRPLPGQQSNPTKMYYCDGWDPVTATPVSVPPTTAPAEQTTSVTGGQ